MLLTREKQTMQIPAVEMSRHIPRTQGQCEKQRPKREVRNYRASKEPTPGVFTAILRIVVFIFFF